MDFTRAHRTQNLIGTYLSHLTVLNSMNQRRLSKSFISETSTVSLKKKG